MSVDEGWREGGRQRGGGGISAEGLWKFLINESVSSEIGQ